MGKLYDEDVGPTLDWYIDNLIHKIESGKIAEEERLIAERTLDQLNDARIFCSETLSKYEISDSEGAKQIESCILLLIHSVYMCGAFVPTLKTSSIGVFSLNTAKARDAALNRAVAVEERRLREIAILYALMGVSDSDWDRASNHSIAKSAEDQARRNFIELGGNDGPDRKTIQRWIEKNIRS